MIVAFQSTTPHVLSFGGFHTRIRVSVASHEDRAERGVNLAISGC
jgi:hypothetical protein